MKEIVYTSELTGNKHCLVNSVENCQIHSLPLLQTTHPGSEVHVGVAKAKAEGRVRDVHDVHSGDHLS